MEKKIPKRGDIKYKIISVGAAIAVWLYVIAVVDPEDKKVIESIPITVTNQAEIERENFVIYPNENVTTDITVSGKLSELQKLNSNNVHVYGEIIRPVEGKNIVTLTSNISNRVSRELKDNTFVINLEKKISKKVPVKISISGVPKEEIYSTNPEVELIKVSGPRTLVNRVAYVGATVKLEDKKGSETSQKVDLIAYDENGRQVNVDISQRKISVMVKFIVEKRVSISIDYKGSESDDKNLFVVPNEVILRGENSQLQAIDKIKTEEIDDDKLKTVLGKKIKLIIPDSVKIKDDIKEVTINKK